MKPKRTISAELIVDKNIQSWNIVLVKDKYRTTTEKLKNKVIREIRILKSLFKQMH